MIFGSAPIDADVRLVRDASRRVAIWISLAVSVLVIAVLLGTLWIVFAQVSPDQLIAPGTRGTVVDIDGVDIVIGSVLVGAAAVVLAGVLALIVTRRAVAPLEDALRRQRRFVADASHELRTPIAILDARLQLLERSLAADDPHAGLVGELRQDSHNLIAIVADLLDSIAEPASGVVVPASVERTVQSAVSAMRMIVQERDVDIIAGETPADVRIAVPEASLHRSLVALLDNAVKHSPPASVVALSTGWNRRSVTISITDHGPGIRGIAPERIFDRFAKSAEAVDGGGSARNGFGIGLSLVQDTVGRYGGSVDVTDTSASGTTITLSLPRSRA